MLEALSVSHSQGGETLPLSVAFWRKKSLFLFRVGYHHSDNLSLCTGHRFCFNVEEVQPVCLSKLFRVSRTNYNLQNAKHKDTFINTHA